MSIRKSALLKAAAIAAAFQEMSFSQRFRISDRRRGHDFVKAKDYSYRNKMRQKRSRPTKGRFKKRISR